jgi:hypothetical protein
MTTLILKLTPKAPSFDGLKRLGKAFGDFVELVAEAKQMARDAQQRFPFVVE